MRVPPMGWSWAVLLAQLVIQDSVWQIRQGPTVALPKDRVILEGVPPPLLTKEKPRVHYQYIDDYLSLIHI